MSIFRQSHLITVNRDMAYNRISVILWWSSIWNRIVLLTAQTVHSVQPLQYTLKHFMSSVCDKLYCLLPSTCNSIGYDLPNVSNFSFEFNSDADVASYIPYKKFPHRVHGYKSLLCYAMPNSLVWVHVQACMCDACQIKGRDPQKHPCIIRKQNLKVTALPIPAITDTDYVLLVLVCNTAGIGFVYQCWWVNF